MLVLMVEDDDSMAILHRLALERAGHHVVVAIDIADARHCLDELVFDAVLCDYNLTAATGSAAELLLEVRFRYPHTRRVLYSNALPWRMKLAAQKVAHSVVDGFDVTEDLVTALAA